MKYFSKVTCRLKMDCLILSELEYGKQINVSKIHGYMMYLFTFVPFTTAIFVAVLLFRKKDLVLPNIRKILWTITAVSMILTLFEAVYYFSIDRHLGKEILYAIYINAPTIFLVLGLSLMIQFMDFVNPK